MMTLSPDSRSDEERHSDVKNVETNALESLRLSQKDLKLRCPTNLASTSKVAIRGVGLRLTYPHNLFNVDEDIISPIVCSMTIDNDSKSVDVAMRRPYLVSTSERR